MNKNRIIIAKRSKRDGNNVVFGIPIEVKKALKKKTRSQRFDALFALTYALKITDFWMHDNEFGVPGGKLELAIKEDPCQDVAQYAQEERWRARYRP